MKATAAHPIEPTNDPGFDRKRVEAGAKLVAEFPMELAAWTEYMRPVAVHDRMLYLAARRGVVSWVVRRGWNNLISEYARELGLAGARVYDEQKGDWYAEP